MFTASLYLEYVLFVNIRRVFFQIGYEQFIDYIRQHSVILDGVCYTDGSNFRPHYVVFFNNWSLVNSYISTRGRTLGR